MKLHSNPLSLLRKEWLLLILVVILVTGCDSPTKPTILNVDRDIPPSAAYDASYGFWGPDGSTIYYKHSEKLGSNPDPGQLDQLWKLDLKTGRREKIHDGRILNADISPDGKWFVFNSFFPPQYLYKMRKDGTELQKLTGPNTPNPNWEYTIQGKWSHDVSHILFSLSAGIPRGISIMDSSGADSHIIVHRGIEPNWSPNANRIIYLYFDTTKVRSTREQIYIANADGKRSRQLTNLKNTYFKLHEPNFSPNSQKIVFIYDDQIYIKNVVGGDAEQVTAGPGYTARPAWSPDGQTILFSRIIPNISKRLYYLDVATHEVKPVFPAKNRTSN